ncbi:MAG TPA: DMT family transporter [Xanthobacteraceae bacterium]|nr:DMT family transporter [Xanthobacteraceae bacterium]
MSPKDRLDPLAAATTAALCASWGFQQVTIKIANSAISPAFQSGLRSLGALLLLVLWCAARGIRLFARDGTLMMGLLVGAMFAAEFALIYWSLVFTEVARSIIFLYTAPFFVALGAHYFVPGERLWNLQIAGLVCAFAGVILALYDGLSLPSSRAFIGDGMMLIAAVLWAATTVAIKGSALVRIDPAKTLAYQLAVSGLALTALAPLFGEKGVIAITPAVIAAMAYQIIAVAFASYLVWFALMRTYPASTLSAFTFLSPVFAMIFGATLLGERVSPLLAAALAFVAFGIWLVNRPRSVRVSL